MDASQALRRLLENLPSPESRRAYEADWARYVVWLELEGVEVERARPWHVEAHITYLRTQKKLKKTTLGRALSVIREVYGALVRSDLMEVNPAREVKPPRLQKELKAPVMTVEQLREVMTLPADTWEERRARMCLCLLLGLGWRRAEVARLRCEDFKDDTVTGQVKGDKTITVGVPPWLLDEMADWRVYAHIDEGPVLPRSPDNPEAISGDIVYQIVKKSIERAGLKGFSPHSLRRTNITLLGQMGVSLKDRQMAVGHSSQAVTERYDKANEAAQKAPGELFAELIK